MPTRAQIAKIWGAARELGLEKAEVYNLCKRVTDQVSISELTVREAALLIDRMVQLGASQGERKPRSRERSIDGVVKLMRREQADYIEDLRKQLGGEWLSNDYYAGACQKLLGLDRPRTTVDASRVIEALKQRVEARARK